MRDREKLAEERRERVLSGGRPWLEKTANQSILATPITQRIFSALAIPYEISQGQRMQRLGCQVGNLILVDDAGCRSLRLRLKTNGSSTSGCG